MEIEERSNCYWISSVLYVTKKQLKKKKQKKTGKKKKRKENKRKENKERCTSYLLK